VLAGSPAAVVWDVTIPKEKMSRDNRLTVPLLEQIAKAVGRRRSDRPTRPNRLFTASVGTETRKVQGIGRDVDKGKTVFSA